MGAGILAHVAAAEPQTNSTVYDPLTVDVAGPEKVLDETIHDRTRQRDLPVRIYLPRAKSPAPVLLYSHGLGGSREGNEYLGRHWSSRGYVVVYLQHPGSDEAVWKNVSGLQRLAAMKQAASRANLLLRLKDVPAVIDQLERWNADIASSYAGRFDLKRLGMSGHSFGALTTQGVSGQRISGGDAAYTDSRIKAAVIMSPSTRQGDPAHFFGGVKIPWLLMTGTEDSSPIGDIDASSRLLVYPALPPGGKYQLVLHEAEHHAFGDRPLPGSRRPRNPHHHKVILALSTAFWDAWLKEDVAARAWLEGEAVTRLLDSQDRWEKK